MKKGPTNPELLRVIEDLRKGKKKNLLLIARKLETATRRRPEVNLWKLDKYSAEGDLVVVPGKVLSEGELSHKITLVAFNISEGARKKLHGKADLMSFDELIKKAPKKMKVMT